MDARERQIARNEALFRRVNEQVESLNETFSTLTNTIVIVCECGAQGCIEQIELSRSEYEHVRSDATQFAVKPGHVFDDVEQVTGKTDRFWIVTKHEAEAAEVARELDTRDR